VTTNDGGECRGQIDQWIDGIEFARFDERGDGCPVFRSRVMSGK